ncbi:MAG: HNH endonuclease, partial [Tepidisphaeraceae bacterium]
SSSCGASLLLPKTERVSKMIDLVGQTFGRWTVLERAANDKYQSSRWLCGCVCGVKRTVRGRSLKRGMSKSCGCWVRELAIERVGHKSPGWRGGRIKSSTGYILVQAPDHPAAQAVGYVPEHRLVMEKTIGRYLRPEETVHHINGTRDDNRPENLELWTSRQPRGQRVADLVAWAEEILELYRSAKIPTPLARHIAVTFRAMNSKPGSRGRFSRTAAFGASRKGSTKLIGAAWRGRARQG